MSVEYLYCSMMGSFFVPCDISMLHDDGTYDIVYFDPALEEMVVKEHVKKEYLDFEGDM